MEPIQIHNSTYLQNTLSSQNLASDPIDQFQLWIKEAQQSDLKHPNAFTLSTVDKKSLQPSSRIVLLKGLSNNKLVFFTNYQSKKGQQLENNKLACALFYWEALERQIRVEGSVQRLSPEESTDYFQTRPHGSQIGAWASQQSKIIDSRDVLEQAEIAYNKQFDNGAVPRPEHWGGYCLTPNLFEFWQGRDNRLHDRFQYLKATDATWTMHRLAP